MEKALAILQNHTLSCVGLGAEAVCDGIAAVITELSSGVDRTSLGGVGLGFPIDQRQTAVHVHQADAVAIGFRLFHG